MNALSLPGRPARRSALLLALLMAPLVAPALAGARLAAASPALGSVSPRGIQRGQEAVLDLQGARLSDAQEVLFYSAGLTVAKLEVVGEGHVRAHLKAAPDCRPGEHALRLRTASGLSELRTFYVGVLPQVDEKEPNSLFEAPQKVSLNCTIAGVVQSEDVDHYAFEARKGQRVSAEVEGMRLGGALFDPALSILNSARFELASADDTPLLGQDAAVSVVIPEDGIYLAQVRESSYGGSDGCLYRLHLGTFPRPLAVLPGGGRPGEELEVAFLGDVLGEARRKVKLPAEAPPGFGLFLEDEGGLSPSPLPFRIAGLPGVLEKEPNEKAEEATPAEAPAALHGVVARPGDVDLFRFKAKKGETFDVQVHARRLRSPLDPVLAVLVPGGGALAASDDAVGPDSAFRFTAPEDREYLLQVSDHLGKGGPHHVYRVEVASVRPRLSVSIPKVAPYSQERQAIAVPRGNRYAALLSASRQDFGGDLVIEAEGLPAGLSFTADTMASAVDAVPVVFEAAAGAPLAGALARLGARHADPAQEIRGGFAQAVELIVGEPGQSVYWKHEADRAAVAITEEAPFKVQIVEPKAPLVLNGAMNLRVKAERQAGFTAPIAIAMVHNPPGVSSAGGVSIPEGKDEAVIPLNASSGAPVRSWKIAVSAAAAVKGGTVWVGSPLATLKVAAPYLNLTLERAAVEQGKETELFVKAEQAVPFEGKVQVELVGLPPRVTAPPVEITRETKEFAFKVKAEPTSPAGVHKNLFCRLVIQESGEPVAHALGSSELRVDVPLPPPPSAPAAPVAAAAAPAPVPAAAAPERRLSRLEKLREEEKERRKAAEAKR